MGKIEFTKERCLKMAEREGDQFCQAGGPASVNLRLTLTAIRNKMEEVSMKGHNTGYDWNADPEGLTLIEGEIDELIHDEQIGWEELSNIIAPALQEAMGDDAFCEWMEQF